MTIIEFFDKTAIENMLSALLCQPDQVIFVGHNRKQMERCLPAYRQVLADRGLQVELCNPVTLNRNNLQAIVEKLSQIVENHHDCVFNLDGGEELYLVAVGIVAQKYPESVQLHRFNIRNNSIIDCDADGNDQLVSPIAISIRENVRIYGGVVVDVDQHSDGTYPWKFTEEFRQDLHTMWEIACRFSKSWNGCINTIGWADQICPQEDPREFRAIRANVEAAMLREGDRYSMSPAILQALEKKHLISWLTVTQQEVEFVFKNEQIKRCLTKAGQLLELMVTMAAMDVTEDGEHPVYQDVQCGVYMDWDGDVAPEGDTDVGNEVDVLLMKGAVPVFISCKNGYLDAEELYKLSQVSYRFGGKYAKRVLIAPQLDKMGARGDYIRARAEDMGIKVVDDFDDMTYDQMKNLMKNLWRTP